QEAVDQQPEERPLGPHLPPHVRAHLGELARQGVGRADAVSGHPERLLRAKALLQLGLDQLDVALQLVELADGQPAPAQEGQAPLTYGGIAIEAHVDPQALRSVAVTASQDARSASSASSPFFVRA